MRNIKTKITGFILIMVIFTIVTMVSVVYNYSFKEILKQAESNNISRVKDLKDYYLSGFVDEMEYMSNSWAEHPNIKNYVKESNQKKMTNKIPYNFIDIHNKWMGAIKSNKDITWMYLALEDDGSIFIAPIDETMPDNYDCRERQWYIDSVASDGIIWSEPYIDAGDSKKILVTVARPIKKDNKLVGVLGLDIELGELSKILNKLSYDTNGEFLLVDSNGIIMAHSDKNMILKSYEHVSNGDFKLTKDIETINYREGDMLEIITIMPINGLNWYVVGESTENLSAMFSKNFSYVILISLILIIIVIIVSKKLSEKLTKPIYEIYDVIKSVENGNLNVRTKIVSNDEIGKLSTGFNNMLDEVESYNSQMKAINEELVRLLEELDENYFDTVRALANAIEASDHYTRGHCDRVEEISIKIAEESNLDFKSIKNLSYACVLHDIGKIGIDPKILNKAEKLTEEEYEVIKKHPIIGFEIIKDVEFLKESSKIILQHHEREDGKGYPYGLTSEEISEESKILSISDAYDAMTSIRPYRDTIMNDEEAISELMKNCDFQFNKKYVLILKNILENSI